MRFNRFLLSLILMLPAINNIAQVLVNVKVDSLQLFIGEQTDITLGVTLGTKQKLQLPALKNGDQLIPNIEVVNVQRPDTNLFDEGKNHSALYHNSMGFFIVLFASFRSLCGWEKI